MSGTLDAIYIAGVKRELPCLIEEVRVLEGLGLEGDRYALKAGSFSKLIEDADAGKHVTLIEHEAVEAAQAEHAEDFSNGRHRRNLVVRGLALNDLINRQIRIGRDVVLRGERHCPPCRHLSRLTETDSLTSLRHRGGLRTSVVLGGVIRVGDPVHVIEVKR